MSKAEKLGRERLLETTLANITKKYGEGAIMRLGAARNMKIEAIPTGSLSLDIALGVGGLPKGRIVEIYGPEASGKTTLCQHIIAEAQKLGGVCAFIDMEHALDPEYVALCGVDIENLFITQPDTGEQALEIAETLVRSGAISVLVIDSVAALVPKAEVEGEMGDSHMGLQARLMSQALRKLAGIVQQTNTLLIFTNQLRMKIGVMFGNPETTTGGNALKFYASVRLDVRRTETLKQGGTPIGNRTTVKVKKNKVAPPFTECTFDITYAEGISKVGEIIDLGVAQGLIDKRGAFLRYQDQLLGQGRENAKQFLAENPTMLLQLETLIRQHAGLPAVGDLPK